MKVDTYTRIVLTVIAICLTWICLRNISLSETVYAQAPPRQEVIIAGVKTRDGLLPVNISSTSANAKLAVTISDVATPDHSLPVKIWGVNTSDKLLPVSIYSATKPLPVSIQSVQQGKPWDSLLVKTAADSK